MPKLINFKKINSGAHEKDIDLEAEFEETDTNSTKGSLSQSKSIIIVERLSQSSKHDTITVTSKGISSKNIAFLSNLIHFASELFRYTWKKQ